MLRDWSCRVEAECDVHQSRWNFGDFVINMNSTEPLNKRWAHGLGRGADSLSLSQTAALTIYQLEITEKVDGIVLSVGAMLIYKLDTRPARTVCSHRVLQ